MSRHQFRVLDSHDGTATPKKGLTLKAEWGSLEEDSDRVVAQRVWLTSKPIEGEPILSHYTGQKDLYEYDLYEYDLVWIPACKGVYSVSWVKSWAGYGLVPSGHETKGDRLFGDDPEIILVGNSYMSQRRQAKLLKEAQNNFVDVETGQTWTYGSEQVEVVGNPCVHISQHKAYVSIKDSEGVVKKVLATLLQKEHTNVST